MQEYSVFLKHLLSKRELNTAKDIKAFLQPDYESGLHNPFLMRDMDRACERLFEAFRNSEKIVIYADYDCDGIPGAVILEELFKLVGFENYEVYIPQRNSEGYGLNLEAIDMFYVSGAKLLITIDLGITAVEEVVRANKYNIDVIVTDHHIPPKKLPKAYAILNPKVDDYPEKMLCGAGVVFKFVQGFMRKYSKEFSFKEGVEKWMLDMAGLATLSDMVPLLGENRTLAYFGLKVLRKSRRPGLVKLLKKMNIAQEYLTEDDVGFMLTPRLNAASRMDDPRRAYELLSTKDEVLGGALADHLSKINDERKYIVANIMREVKKKFETREVKEVIVVGNPEWKVGVLGLVAGKLVEEYSRPVFVWGKDDRDIIKGSCRSDGSVSLVELMTESSESFLEYGGHELAGGFAVHSEKVHFLEEVLSNTFTKVRKQKTDDSVDYDCKLLLTDVNMTNWRDLEKLAPFGVGNSKPVFLFENVKIEQIKKFGKNGSGEHLEVIFSNGKNKNIKAISFFSSPESFKAPIVTDGLVNLIASFDLSRFGRREELRLRIVDII